MQGFQRQRGEYLVFKVDRNIHLKKVVNLGVLYGRAENVTFCSNVLSF